MQGVPFPASASASTLGVSEPLGGTGVGSGEGQGAAGPNRTVIITYGLCNAIVFRVPVDTWEQYLSSFQCHSRTLEKN